MIHSKN